MDQVKMRTIDELWEQIVIEGLKEKVGKDYIRNSLIDAMRKEIFDQIMFRAGVEDMDDLPENPKNVGIVSNVFTQGIKKWRSIVKKCNSYEQTLNLICEDDLNDIWKKESEDTDESGDWDGDEATAEWPELCCESADDVSNLIADMATRGATDKELERAVAHSKTVLDTDNPVEWKQSELDNGIQELVIKYKNTEETREKNTSYNEGL